MRVIIFNLIYLLAFLPCSADTYLVDLNGLQDSNTIQEAIPDFVITGETDFILCSGSTEITIVSDQNYTIGLVFFNGMPILDYLGSNQGTVLNIDSVWCGSGHGFEDVLEVKLMIDGVLTPIEDGITYTGEEINLHRRTCLGQAYILNSTLNIHDSTIEENVTLQGFDATKVCSVFYGFLGSRSNCLTSFVAISEEGEIIQSDITDKDDYSVTHLNPAVAVAQYDSLEEYGVLTIITAKMQMGLDCFIWDRPYDNKLYARFTECEGVCCAENFFDFTQKMIFFEAPRQDWQNLVNEIYWKNDCTNPPSMDINSDCKVNFVDFYEFALEWMTCGLENQSACWN